MKSVSMNHKIGHLVLCKALLLISSQLLAQDTGTFVTLETGDQYLVPPGHVNIEGLPILLSPSDLEEIEQARQELNDKGFISRPNDLSLARNAFTLMEREARADLSRSDDSRQFNVIRISPHSVEQNGLGRITSEMFDQNSLGYMAREISSVTRVFKNTKLGDLYVAEFANSSIRFGGESEPPNYNVNGLSGYITSVKYSGNEMRTTFLAEVRGGVVLLETGGNLQKASDKYLLDELLFAVMTETY